MLSHEVCRTIPLGVNFYVYFKEEKTEFQKVK